jgi:hypothetical protein
VQHFVKFFSCLNYHFLRAFHVRELFFNLEQSVHIFLREIAVLILTTEAHHFLSDVNILRKLIMKRLTRDLHTNAQHDLNVYNGLF